MSIWKRLLGKNSKFTRMASINKVGMPAYPKRNYKQLAQEGYVENVVGFRCTRLIAEGFSNCRILATDRRGKVDLDHDVYELLDAPNPGQSGPEFLDALASYILLSGNGYIEGVLLREKIAEIYAHRPDRIKIVPGRNGWPVAYEYTAGGQSRKIAVNSLSEKQQRMAHIKSFHPLDDYYGLGAMEPGGWSIDLHNHSSAYNNSLLENGGSPSGFFVYKDEENGDMMPELAYKRAQRSLQERFSSMDNNGKPMLLEGGLDWKAMADSLKDMEFTDARAASAREICFGLGVPPMILGIPGDNTYANFAEANRALYRQTIIPVGNRILKALARWLQASYPGLHLQIDEDEISALSGERAEKWKRVSDAEFMTISEKREALGLGQYKPDEKDPASHIMVNGGQMPLEHAVEDIDTSEGPEPPEPKDE